MPSDLLDAATLRDDLLTTNSLWRQVEVVDETVSTNSDLAARARDGEPGGTVLIADHQTAARGRLGRTWTAPPGTAVGMSLLVRPEAMPPARWPWLPLLTGIAVSESLRRSAQIPAELKWPNDVLVRDRKVCGILAERVDTPDLTPGCVIGVGINTHLTADQLPVPTATSIQLQPDAASVSRTTVITTVLRAFELLYRQWVESPDDTALAAAYLARCGTIGRQVRVILPNAEDTVGEAEAIDTEGRLVVRTESGRSTFGAADIVHLR